MARPKPTKRDFEIREKRRREWIAFRKVHLFTQVKLADALEISRRGVQLVEQAKTTPVVATLRKFALLKTKYKNETIEWN
jgi:DNA-binding XRE family transcriptional regulator